MMRTLIAVVIFLALGLYGVIRVVLRALEQFDEDVSL